MQLEKELQKKAFRDMLGELDQNALNENTKWTDVKGKLKDDPRYKSIGSKTEREKLFVEHIAELMAQRQVGNAQKRGQPEPEEKKPDRKEEENTLMELLKKYVTQTNVLYWLWQHRIAELVRGGEAGREGQAVWGADAIFGGHVVRVQAVPAAAQG